MQGPRIQTGTAGTGPSSEVVTLLAAAGALVVASAGAARVARRR